LHTKGLFEKNGANLKLYNIVNHMAIIFYLFLSGAAAKTMIPEGSKKFRNAVFLDNKYIVTIKIRSLTGTKPTSCKLFCLVSRQCTTAGRNKKQKVSKR